MPIEKTTDMKNDKEAAERQQPLSEKISPDLHKIAQARLASELSTSKTEPEKTPVVPSDVMPRD